MAKSILAQTPGFGKVEFNPRVKAVSAAYKAKDNPLYQQSATLWQ